MQLEEGKAAWAALKSGFMDGVRALRGGSGVGGAPPAASEAGPSDDSTEGRVAKRREIELQAIREKAAAAGRTPLPPAPIGVPEQAEAGAQQQEQQPLASPSYARFNASGSRRWGMLVWGARGTEIRHQSPFSDVRDAMAVHQLVLGLDPLAHLVLADDP